MPKYYQEAIDLARDLEAQRAKVASHKDPNLTEAGLSEARRAALKALRDTAGTRATDIKTRAEARAYMARLAATTVRPKIKDDPAALIRMQQKWEQAKTLLDSGRDIHDVIRNADTDTLLAIEEFGPSYVQSKQPQPSGLAGAVAGRPDEGRPDLSRAIDQRLMEISPADVVSALREALEAEQDAAAAAPYIEHVSQFAEQGVSHYSMLDLAVYSQMANAPVAAPGAESSEAAPASAAA